MCLESESDGVVNICRKLQQKYPDKARLLFQDDFYENNHEQRFVFKNPKVRNLRPAYEATASEYVWMVDSKIYAEPGTLSNLMAEMMEGDASLACIHCNPLFKNSETELTVEKLYFYTHHSRQYCGSAFLGQPCLTGQSVLAKRSK